MVRLFLVVLGGRVDGCHIELHDVRFVAGATIEDTLPQLREQWFGRRRGLHIDSWLALDGVAGWRLQLHRQPYAGPERLWFVNGGGYDPAALAELHSFSLLVASSRQAARAQARAQLLPGARLRHVDDIHPIVQVDGWQLHLSADAEAGATPLRPDWFGYRRIDQVD